jgi:hypothetical protein
MAKRLKKALPQLSQKPRPSLTVIQGGKNAPESAPSPQPQKNNRLIYFILAVTALACISIWYSLSSNRNYSDPVTVKFFDLYRIYQTQGLAAFIDTKKELAAQIQPLLNSKSMGEELNSTYTIAVYLFPELLPDWNFEKQEALELWAPLQLEIEKKSRSPEARKSFEEMRALFWNYEPASRSHPKLSAYTNEIIRIYDLISSP